ncbi:MAG: NADH-quinone oxidoreductase subunit J [Sphingomonadales bacterium]|nr:NADH-quinone oxidoreductase subunit J [Sphingomonadales bacterium]
MVVQALSFYLFATIAVLAGLMVISSRNPVHSVLYLILAFFNSAALFVLMGAEFLAMILLIVYVGAVAVLFLFVVMMLDINFVELRKGALRYLPIGALIGLVLLAELIILVGGQVIEADPVGALHAIPDPEQVTNTEALGRLLYTDYIYVFQAAGMILLVAMIGAIVLTHRVRAGVRKQNIARQVGRTRAEAVQLKKVEPGQGL